MFLDWKTIDAHIIQEYLDLIWTFHSNIQVSLGAIKEIEDVQEPTERNGC